ncbi:hypothetical protein [Paraburkholderia sp.]|uniref:hypothetical protein n=1 Tax=Paraburkholderia sp. TaxID=1926495 RepID=UPI00238D9FE6|nr:hypothetical protein [Paraburkholderia sp.]MDE1182322.1 hypothetical protein [Paraburkholderia sp.]
MKLGKLAARHDPRVPHLLKHMMSALAAPSADWTKAVKSWPMLANDVHGDCTAAAVYHLIQCWLANNGFDFTPTDEQTLALYGQTSGFPKVDQGAVEVDVLKYWSTVGVPTEIGTDAVTFASLKPQDLNDLRLSVQWFGGVYLGVALPLTAQTQEVWDVVADAPETLTAANSWGGHAICAVAYDKDTFTVVTWGKLVKVTNAFMQMYCDEAYAVLSRDWLANSGISPPGLNWDGLQRELAGIAV